MGKTSDTIRYESSSHLIWDSSHKRVDIYQSSEVCSADLSHGREDFQASQNSLIELSLALAALKLICKMCGGASVTL